MKTNSWSLPCSVEKDDVVLMLCILDVVEASTVEFSDTFIVIEMVLSFNVPELLFSGDWVSNVESTGSIDSVFASFSTDVFPILSALPINAKGQIVYKVKS